MELTLFQIEQEKADLIAFREECESPEERAAVDKQIQQYVRDEIRKVTSIAGLLQYFDSMVTACKNEQARIAKKRAKWEGCYGRLRQMALQAMIEIGKTKLEDATARLRIQKNPPAVEIADATAVPDKYLKATIKMPLWMWKKYAEAQPVATASGYIEVTSEIDTALLKTALQAGEVPGARIVQREHLRCE